MDTPDTTVPPADVAVPVVAPSEGPPCKWCGKPLVLTGRVRRKNRKFCNTGCRNGWHLARRKLAMEQIRTAVDLLTGSIKLLDNDDE
jgi:hypothetical protein